MSQFYGYFGSRFGILVFQGCDYFTHNHNIGTPE